MNKVLFFNWQFSNEPINFLKLNGSSSVIPEKSWHSPTNLYQEKPRENHGENQGDHDEIDNKSFVDVQGLDKDIQWISNGEQLEQIVKKYTNSIIKDSHQNFVIGAGPWDGTMVIGESPDQVEGQWESLVGDNKILLKKMLNYIQVNVDEVFLTTFSYWQPKNNRSLTAEELSMLRKFIVKQIDLVQPKKILLLGSVAANGLLETHKPLNGLRGQIHKVNEIPTVVTFNPGFLKRFPNFAAEAKKDMDLFKTI
jgi:DNA polymerase